MVDRCHRRFSHDSCAKPTTFIVQGIKPTVYCKTHAADGLVGVKRPRRCSNISCARQPAWCLLTDDTASVYPSDMSYILGGPAVNLRAKFNAAGCWKLSIAGLRGEQPTHCRDHGPVEDGLVCTDGSARRKISSPRPSSHSAMGSSFHVRAECSF